MGGETLISLPQHSGAAKQIISKATTTSGHALLFRKDLTHEGLVLKAGAKELISLNVWVTRKACRMVLLVTFPGNAMGVDGADGADGANGADAPLHALSCARSYALSARAIRAIPTCIFNGKLDFDAAQRAASGAANIIVTFECRDCSYDDFAVVWRVLNGLYVPVADLVTGARVLDFFGVPAEASLVDCANKDNKEATPAAARAAASAAAAQAQLAGTTAEELRKMTVAQLRKLLASCQVPCKPKTKKGDLVKLALESAAAAAAGAPVASTRLGLTAQAGEGDSEGSIGGGSLASLGSVELADEASSSTPRRSARSCWPRPPRRWACHTSSLTCSSPRARCSTGAR